MQNIQSLDVFYPLLAFMLFNGMCYNSMNAIDWKAKCEAMVICNFLPKIMVLSWVQRDILKPDMSSFGELFRTDFQWDVSWYVHVCRRFFGLKGIDGKVSVRDF